MPSNVISTVIKSGNGRVWMQPSGPATGFLYGGCYGIGDLTQPEGDLTPIFCPSPTQPNKWDIVDFTQGTPGNPTGNLEAPLDLVNYLITIKCPFGVQYRIQQCATPESPTAWEQMVNLKGVRITSRGITNLNPRTPDTNAQVLTTADITFEKFSFVKRMEFAPTDVGLGSSADFRAISFCDEPTCPGACGAGSAGCQTGFAVTAGLAAGDQVRKTEDGGATWEAITSPFTSIYDDIVDVACKGDVVIIVNGTTAGRIARSQDGGETWSVVTLPDAEIANKVFMLDVSRIWVAAANGYIFYSADGGLTWITQSAGDATTEDLEDIFMYNSTHGWAVGTSGAIVATIDGANWAAQTSGIATTLNAVHAITNLIVYAGGASGELLKTVNGGTTWASVTWFGAATDVINAITSIDEAFVFFGGRTVGSAGFIYQSVDGGVTAEALTLPTNAGVNSIAACEPDLVYAAADESLILKGS